MLIAKRTCTMEWHFLGEDNIPALLFYRSSDSKKPLLLLFHGLTGRKEGELFYATRLAEEGYLVAAIDARQHGDRVDLDFWKKVHYNLPKEVVKIVVETAQDVPAIIEALLEREDIDPERIGIAGGSLGGFITILATMLDRRLKAAVSIAGGVISENSFDETEIYELLCLEKDLDKQVDEEMKELTAKNNPFARLDKFYPTSLLMVHGDIDNIVPLESHQRLYEALKPYYKDAPDKLNLKIYPGVDHSIGALPEAMDDIAKWLKEHL